MDNEITDAQLRQLIQLKFDEAKRKIWQVLEDVPIDKPRPFAGIIAIFDEDTSKPYGGLGK